jgi:hypothetical protein
VGDTPAQPLSVQASQQLEKIPTHAEPPFGALHCAASLFVEQRVLPFLFVLQHVTKPSGFPHVERAAHLTTEPLQFFGSRLASARSLTTSFAQRTYCP